MWGKTYPSAYGMVNPMPAPSDEDATKQAARPGLWRQIGADLRRGRSIELYIRLFADQFETLWESGRPVSLRG